MPSGPSLFDDEARPHAPVPGNAAESPIKRSDNTPATRSGRDPNYLIRRAVVVGVVVAVVAVTAIAVARLIGSSSDSAASSGTIDAEWNRVVLVDERSGRVLVDDADGKEVARVESKLRAPTSSRVVARTAFVIAADAVAVVDLDDETSTSFDLGDAAIIQPAGSTLTMVAVPPSTDRALLVHGPTGDTIDTDALEPLVGARYEFANAHTGSSGRDVLVTDSGNFQSVLLSFDRDAPSYFPGLALAIGEEIVVTAQNVGSDATVSVFDHDGNPVTTARTPSVRAAMVTANSVLLATVDGDLLTLATSSGDTETLAPLEVGTVRSGAVTPTGDRLIITGSDGTAIVDSDGKVIETFDGQFPTGDDAATPRGGRCLTLGDESSRGESRVSVVDFTDGSVLVEAVAETPITASADGCVVGSTTSEGYDILSVDGVKKVTDGDTLVALSPDGTAVVVERDNRITLVTRAAPDADRSTTTAEPVDLGPRGRQVGFSNR